MADDRTEQPTSKKRSDARKKGQVARSRDLTVAAASLAATVAIGRFGERLMTGLGERLASGLGHLGDRPLQPIADTELSGLVVSGGLALASLVGPLAMATMFAGVATQFVQGGWVLSSEKLTLNWGALSPAKGLKRFAPMQAWIETLKTFLAVAVIVWLAWSTIATVVMDGGRMSWMTPLGAAHLGWTQAQALLWRVGWGLAALAIADYALVHYRHTESLLMTKQEIKDEMKNQESNPEMKARVRRIAREMMRKRMLSNMKRATVVITNPTHFAVALEDRRGEMAAPVVLAKGQDHMALTIRARARDHGVPIVENRPLAQALYKTAEIGDVIPAPLFTAVAEVLAQLIRLKQISV